MKPTKIIFSGLRGLNRELQKPDWQDIRFVILLDENVFQHCLPLLVSQVPALQEVEFVEVPVGEDCKSPEVASQVWQTLAESGHDRHSVLLALGGGCVTDLGGYVAAGYMRGIRHILVPTSLIGMADAAIGGKTAVNLAGVKNLVGHFYAPALTVIEPDFLDTLPPVEALNGTMEMVKTAAVANPDLYARLLSDTAPSRQAVTEVARIKQAVVKSDPNDLGIRHILNFGHTFGHAIEAHSLAKGSPLAHGLAVGVGMMVAMYLSWKKTGLDESVYQSYSKWIRSKVQVPFYGLKDIESMLALMRLDKKNANGEILCVLLRDLGTAVIDVPVDDNEIRDAFLATCK